ncbi:MAG: hypothetical protein A2Z34_09370 [Planctomycetes bacterium RBG_16_59_8]|nr:MAG: hypothetical protein A2Z34_09370 [Planctomycetes bacterium RBG_16_59_8]
MKGTIPIDFPGADVVVAGIADLLNGRETIAALLVSIGTPRLRREGVDIPAPISSPEIKLYRRLSVDNPDAAHSRYNALIRRLVSFERALSCVNR